MMYPMRRFFHVKIWLTEISSDDDDDEEKIVICESPSTAHRPPNTHYLRPGYTTHHHHHHRSSNRRKHGKYLEATSTNHKFTSSDCDSSEGYETFDELSYLGYVSHLSRPRHTLSYPALSPNLSVRCDSPYSVTRYSWLVPSFFLRK